LTSGRVVYTTTGGLETASANLTFNGTTLTTANDASISGLTVGKGGSSVSTNTALGYQALTANTSGDRSVAVGYQSAVANTTGINTSIGYQSLYTNTTGTENTAVGFLSLNKNTTGSYNSSLSDQALYNNTTGSNNVGVGFQALASSTTAYNNTAVGYQAGYTTTTAANTVCIGYKAGFAQTTVGSNVYIGESAGLAATGGNNTFIGDGSGYLITSGQKNSILGSYTGNNGGLDIRTASNYIVLSDGDGNPRGYFDANGYFYITQADGKIFGGTTTGRTVWANSDGTNYIIINGSANGSSPNQINFITNINKPFVMDSSGNLLVGTTSATGTPTQGMQVLINSGASSAQIGHANGTASGNEYAGFSYNATKIGSITQNGTTGVLYNITSDYRLKDVIGAVSGAGERIDALQPIDYTFKADGSKHRGFLAHQFQAVYANSVTGEKDAVDAEGSPVYQQMQASTSEVIADLVAEIQSLRARLKAANIA
jgi:hypothetical protein